ncbi:MAG: hypothetical protein KJ915_02110 [Candidatus Omnitrophica bacterium]|nr:hypothetical protein [Candidatus Omnitrophota bacterium]
MKFKLFITIFFSIMLCLSLESIAAKNESSGVIDELELHDLIGEQIYKDLNEEKRLVPLPCNIARIYTSPEHVPIFVMDKGDNYYRASFDRVLKSFLKLNGQFHLMIDGEVIGWGKEEELVIVGGKMQEGVIVKNNKTKNINIPKGIKYSSAYNMGGQWFFNSSDGLRKEAGEPIISEEIIRHSSIIPAGEDLIVLPENQGKIDKDYIIYIINGKEGAINKIENKNFPLSNMQVALHCQDGRWIVIGSKIAFLNEKYDSKPKEEDLNNIIEYAKNKDIDKLVPLLKKVSVYDKKYFRDISQELRKIPSQYIHLERLEHSLISVMHSMQNEDYFNNEINDEDKTRKLNETLNKTTDQIERAINEIDSITGLMSPYSIRRIGDLLSQGYQYFDGRWISGMRVLENQGAAGVYLLLRYIENDTGNSLGGIFHLKNDGHLYEVYSFDKSIGNYGYNIRFMRDEMGRIVLFLPQNGLARIEEGTLVWLDKSLIMKSMEQCIGSDKNGRIYFLRKDYYNDYSKHQNKQFWVYKSNFNEHSQPPIKLLPASNKAVMDSKGRIWFISNSDSFFSSGIMAGFEKDNFKIIDKKVTWLSPDEKKELDKNELYRESYTKKGNIFCCEGKNIFQYPIFVDERNTKLIPGKNGSICILSEESSYVIQEENLWKGRDFHELAQKYFELLLRIAPDKCYVDNASQKKENNKSNMNICLFKDILWICDNNKVEIYKDSRPLFIQKRIDLSDLPVKVDSPAILGPIKINSTEQMMILANKNCIQDIFLAVPDESGIKLERLSSPSEAWVTGTLTEPGNIYSLPLIDYTSGCVYFYNNYDRVWKTIDKDTYLRVPYSGRPVLINKEGKLIVERNQRVYKGYRIISDIESKSINILDIKDTYVENLNFICEQEDGRILCFGPEGIVWLEEDLEQGYKIVQTKAINPVYKLKEFIGSSERKLYFLCVDHENKYCIIAVDH